MTASSSRITTTSNRPAIPRVVAAHHEFVGLETVHELGDVGPDTQTAVGQGSQRHGLAVVHQLREGIELGEREAQGFERAFQPLLHGVERPQEGADASTTPHG